MTLEYLERNFYADVLKKFSATDFKKAGYAPRVRERFQALAKQEASHVQFLEAALGTNAVSDCSYIFGLTSVKAVVSTARLLENIGVSAYLGAAGDIQSKEYLAAAGSILTVEARHASVRLTHLLRRTRLTRMSHSTSTRSTAPRASPTPTTRRSTTLRSTRLLRRESPAVQQRTQN